LFLNAAALIGVLKASSTRGYVSSAETFIGGFVIEGTGPRTVLIRADGPVLYVQGVKPAS